MERGGGVGVAWGEWGEGRRREGGAVRRCSGCGVLEGEEALATYRDVCLETLRGWQEYWERSSRALGIGKDYGVEGRWMMDAEVSRALVWLLYGSGVLGYLW